jgi:peptide/nickel transport system substrate-binding protein
MKKSVLSVCMLLLCGLLFAGGGRQSGSGSSGGGLIQGANVPRNETIIIENTNDRVIPADNFNYWAGGGGVWALASSGFQQLSLDTLWYIDPDAGLNGVWENALASEKPIYNNDFTQMTVKLRKGIYWSDGVEFTADDLIYTVDIQMKTPGMFWSGVFVNAVDRIEKIDSYTVKFYLKAPNSRFHVSFIVRWNACWMMPKHIFEKQSDVLAYTFNPPIALGPYKLKDYDPQGDWYLWEKRDDWKRTTLALMGDMSQGPKYAMYINAGTDDAKLMAQRNHQLDIIADLPVEGVISLMRSAPETKSWFPGFPWGHPDPTLMSVYFNNEKPGLNNKDVRWALTLAIDMVQVGIASSRGALTMSPVMIPPTGMYPSIYINPLESWLKAFSLDLGDGTSFKPYDPDMAVKVADEARKSLGDLVPTNPADIRRYVGAGWWKKDLAAAEKLMKKAGMRRNSRNIWEFGDGKPFKVDLIVNAEFSSIHTRGAAAIVENWKAFGIDSTLVSDANAGTLGGSGEFDTSWGWNIQTWGGHPDLFFSLGTFHSDMYRPIGEKSVGENYIRWKDPRLDKIIDGIKTLDFDDPKAIELGKDFVKLAVEEMPEIPLMSLNSNTMMDPYYWTGYPNINDPYTDPVPSWANSRYMFVRLKPTGK